MSIQAVEVTDGDVEALVEQLRGRRSSAAAATSSAPTSPQRQTVPFMGDRGSFHQEREYMTAPSPLEPTSPSGRPEATGFEDPRTEELAREAEHLEEELRVLKAESENREEQATRLRNQVREAELALKRASHAVGTLSYKVEATSGSRHAVLEASAQHIDSHVGALRRRLAQKEFELQQKDEETARLWRAIEGGGRRIQQQQDQVLYFEQSLGGHDSQATSNGQHRDALQRYRSINEWRDRVHAGLAHQEREAEIVVERRGKEEELMFLDQEIATLSTFIAHMEDKRKACIKEALRAQEHHDALGHEERMYLTANNLGREQALQHRRQLAERAKMLEARIQDERARQAERADQARAYDDVDAKARHHENQLKSLVSCMKQAQRTLLLPRTSSGFDSEGDGSYWPAPPVLSPPLSMPLQLGGSPLYGA